METLLLEWQIWDVCLKRSVCDYKIGLTVWAKFFSIFWGTGVPRFWNPKQTICQVWTPQESHCNLSLPFCSFLGSGISPVSVTGCGSSALYPSVECNTDTRAGEGSNLSCKKSVYSAKHRPNSPCTTSVLWSSSKGSGRRRALTRTHCYSYCVRTGVAVAQGFGEAPACEAAASRWLLWEVAFVRDGLWPGYSCPLPWPPK